MKTKLILSAALFAVVFASCKKKDTTTPEEPATTTTTGGTPATVFLISKDSASNGTTTNDQVRKFEYNSSKKLVRVWYKQGTSTTFSSRDTIQYNASGQVSKVERFNSGSSVATISNIYNYVSGVLTTVNETGSNSNGAFVRTRNFAYTSGKLSSQTIVYTTGSGGGGPEDITGIVFNGNNMSTANLTGIGAITLTSSTTAPNPYYGLNFNTDDFLNMFNQNNVLQAYLTATPAQIFVNNTFTYANGRVATISDASSSPSYVTTLSYVEL